MDKYQKSVLQIIQDIIKNRKKEKHFPFCAMELAISAAAYRQHGLAPEVTKGILDQLVNQQAITMHPVMNGRSYYINQSL